MIDKRGTIRPPIGDLTHLEHYTKPTLTKEEQTGLLLDPWRHSRALHQTLTYYFVKVILHYLKPHFFTNLHPVMSQLSENINS